MMEKLPETLESLDGGAEEGSGSRLAQIPVVDYQQLCYETSGNAGKFQRCGGKEFEKFRFACTELGFLQLVNHTVPAQDIHAVFAAAEGFFSLPETEKAKLSMTSADRRYLLRNRGYFGTGSEDLDQFHMEENFRGDMKEGIDFGLEDPIRSKLDARNQAGSSPPSKWHVGNQWPEAETLPAFRPAVESFMEKAAVLAKEVTRQFARVLQIHEDELLHKFQSPAVNLRMLHYLAARDAEEHNTEQVMAGAHTDYGCCTLLLQDNTGGLQVEFNQAWVDVPPIDNAFVVNIGDMLSSWTQGIFKSTIHRVIRRRPSPGEPLRHRYSIPFFWNPSPDVTITPLPLDYISTKGKRELASTVERHAKVAERELNPHETFAPIGKTVDGYLTHRYHRAFARSALQ